jgi:hypothetical protein
MFWLFVWVSVFCSTKTQDKAPETVLFDNNHHRYYAFDDDNIRNIGVTDLHQKERGECRRVSDYRLNFPNCNGMHEMPLLQYNVKYLK